MPENEKKKHGRPSHQISQETIDIVEDMAINGATHIQMADALKICEKTLVLHYGDLLKSSKHLFDAKVARQIKRFIFHHDPKIAIDATKFYANSKMGWKQQQTVEQHTTVAVDEQTLEQMKGLSISDLINVGKGLERT